MADRVDLIESTVAAADMAFKGQFNITFTATTPTRRTDLTDACTANPNGPCTSECPYEAHHKHRLRISDQLYYGNELYDGVESDSERIVYWTDRPRGTYCDHDTNECRLVEEDPLGNTVLAVVFDCRPVMHIMNLQPDGKDPEKDEACMGITLIHETAHTFGLDDRYEGYDHNEAGYQCVMEFYTADEDEAFDFYSAIKNGEVNAFCDECADDLLVKLLENDVIQQGRLL